MFNFGAIAYCTWLEKEIVFISERLYEFFFM